MSNNTEKVRLSDSTINHTKKMQTKYNWSKEEAFEYAKKYEETKAKPISDLCQK